MWNEKVDQRTKLMLLPISIHDKIYTNRARELILEFAFNVELLIRNRKEKWELCDNLEKYTIYMTGNDLSIVNVYGFIKKLDKKEQVYYQTPMRREKFFVRKCHNWLR